MRASIRYLIPLGVFVAIAVFLLIGLGLNPRLLPSPLIGKPMPQFSLPALDDPERHVGSEALFGDVAVVNVWASWCVSCRQEHPVLMALAREHGVPIYGINYKDPLADATTYLRRVGNPYVWSGHDLDGWAGIEWGVYATPETFVIDRTGTIRYKHIGPISMTLAQTELLPLIERLRSEP